MSNLADKVTSASTEDKALFKNVNLLGRDYGEDSDAVTRAVLNLKAKILAKKAAAQAAIAEIEKSVADSCAAADVAAGAVVLWENKQSTAMRSEGAAQEGQVNATLAVKETESSQAAATCGNAQQSQATSKGPHTAEIAACTSEMTYIDAMTQNGTPSGSWELCSYRLS